MGRYDQTLKFVKNGYAALEYHGLSDPVLCVNKEWDMRLQFENGKTYVKYF